MPTIALCFAQGAIPRSEKKLLLAAVLKRDRAWVLAHPEYSLSKAEEEHFQHLVRRREQHEPLAYILGEKEFYGLAFSVNEHTLIPRPETELLVETALSFVSSFKFQVSKRIAVIDVGTGSGCIIVSLARYIKSKVSTTNEKEFPRAPDSKLLTPTFQFFATDISPEALQVAKENAERHRVEKDITFLQSDLLDDVRIQLKSFDVILVLANLPYLSETLYRSTDPTVQDFEPETALVSGPDGLDHYRRLLAKLRALAPEKSIEFWLEISPEQAPLIPVLCAIYGATLEAILPDLAGKARIVHGTF